MTVLTRGAIWKALEGPKDDCLVITPLFSLDQVGTSSIDVRLGNEFILFKRRNVDAIDIAKGELRRRLPAYQEKIRIEFKESFTIHPGQLVLSCTLEYIKLPSSLAGYILGRSSWGRLGLVIQMASAIAPNFAGSITLELANIGQVPLVLYPGTRVAQLILHEADQATTYEGRYKFPTGPQFSRVDEDDDLGFWCGTSEEKSDGS